MAKKSKPKKKPARRASKKPTASASPGHASPVVRFHGPKSDGDVIVLALDMLEVADMALSSSERGFAGRDDVYPLRALLAAVGKMLEPLAAREALAAYGRRP